MTYGASLPSADSTDAKVRRNACVSPSGSAESFARANFLVDALDRLAEQRVRTRLRSCGVPAAESSTRNL
jgi:hypothetical protein